MSRYRGTVVFEDMGPGQWVLRTTAGDFALYGEVSESLKGKMVIVDGDIVGAMGFSMTTSQAIQVRSIRRA